MRLRRKSSPLRLLIWLIPLGLAIFVASRWNDVSRVLAGRTSSSPGVGSQATAEAPPPDNATPAPTEALGPDGFPVNIRKHVLKYTVQPGDALLLIAERFHISPDTIFWANTETLRDNIDLILVGTQLYILPVDGVYHLADGKLTIADIAKLYGVAPEAILQSDYNELSQVDAAYIPPSGLRVVVPGGRREYLTWQSPFRTGTESGQANPQGTIHPGSCREHYTGAGGSGQYENPVKVAYRVTTGFEPWHPGVDLAADRNTPIYAADTGVIVFSGWNRTGYGELLIIDHGGGWTTFYGHLSTRFVGCGDQVQKGQKIGLMGMTGNASGFHLHFEIRKDDVPQNPFSYIEVHDSRDTQNQP